MYSSSMTAAGVVDLINRETMRSCVLEYAQSDELTPSESAALSSVIEHVRGRRILDLGVGGGRTVRALRQLSRHYVGVDYVPEMVEQCRARFPQAEFEHGDARSLPQFASGSFDVAMFSLNGISMVEHDDRMAILREVRRLLTPDGVFIFSTYNQDSPEHNRVFEFPDFEFNAHPVKLAKRVARFAINLGTRIVNRARYLKHEKRGSDFSMVNDRCHNYATMLYYISLENQRRQLEQAGFSANATVFDLRGEEVTDSTRDDSMTFVARPRRLGAVVVA